MTGVDAVLLNGTVGAGKTTTAHALSHRLHAQRVPHAVVDLDQVRLLIPAPPGDPFQHEVELANLRDLARNYREAGATRLVLAGVVEEPGEVARYVAALGGRSLLVCRLLVDPDAARARLRNRHADDVDGRDWHLRRTTELAAVLDRAQLDDATVDTTLRTPAEVAADVERLAGWAPQGR